jgi:hypothetical protein
VSAVLLALVLAIADWILARQFPAWFAAHPTAMFAGRCAAVVVVFYIANFGLRRPPGINP